MGASDAGASCAGPIGIGERPTDTAVARPHRAISRRRIRNEPTEILLCEVLGESVSSITEDGHLQHQRSSGTES